MHDKMKNTIKILGIFFGVFSIVSFTQRIFDVSLFSIAKEIIAYYRIVAYFFFNLPARLLGFSFPNSLIDIWTLSFIGATAYFKTLNIHNSKFFHYYHNLTETKYWKAIFVLIWGFSGIGI